jgi:hypothetical protein
MTASPVQRDERTVVVENVSYRRAYFVMAYGALAIVAYRALVFRDAMWDLMGLVVASGVVSLAYQSRQDVPQARKNFLVTVVVAVLTSLLMGLFYWRGLLG